MPSIDTKERSTPAVQHVTATLDAAFDPPKAVFVGTGGNISMVDQYGATKVWKNIPNGSIVPFRPQLINSSGTTAADMLLLY